MFEEIITFIIGLLVTGILVPLFLKYIPLSKVGTFAFNLGKKISAKGNSLKYVSPSYEAIESTVTGTVLTFSEQFVAGLKSDN
jgi:hypothetical protein